MNCKVRFKCNVLYAVQPFFTSALHAYDLSCWYIALTEKK